MRTRNSLINSVVSFLIQLVIIVVSFISRYFFIKVLGSEYLGLNGIFTNILSVLAVSELGIGTAITFSLYQPLHENDTKKVAGIMNLFKKTYMIIGFVIAAFCCILLPFIQLFAKGYTLDLGYIRFIFVLFAANTIMTYFLGYCRTLLFASQQNYIISIVDFIFKIVLNAIQIIILLKTGNYVFYLMTNIVITILNNLVIIYITKKKYAFLVNNKEKIDNITKRTIVNNIKYLSVSALISVGVLGVDNLIISALIGLVIGGYYSNYSMITVQIQLLFTTLLNGIVASLGDLIAEGNNERINFIYNVYNQAYFFVASFTTVSLFILLNPFIGELYGSEYLFKINLVILMVIINYMYFMRQPIWQYQNAAGIFKYYVPYSALEFFLNISISIIIALKFGIVGVFIGKIIAFIVSWTGQAYILNRYVLFSDLKKYYVKQIKFMIVVTIECFIAFVLTYYVSFNNFYVDFVYKMFVCLIIPNVFNLLIYHNTVQFKYLLDIIKSRILSKFNKTKKLSA